MLERSLWITGRGPGAKFGCCFARRQLPLSSSRFLQYTKHLQVLGMVGQRLSGPQLRH